MFFRRKAINVLSIDGGGIRGLIPLYVLREIELRLGRRGIRKPLTRVFDLMAGTSAGALIVLALNAPGSAGPAAGRSDGAPQFSVDDLIAFFEKHGIVIFPHGMFEQLREIAHFFRDKYSARPLENLMLSLFGDRTLRQAVSNVLVTAYDVENRRPFLFRKRAFQGKGAVETDFYMRDIVRAATAAPTFFEPAIIETASRLKDAFCLVDGAVFAQNPSLAAYVEARAIFGRNRRLNIVSLGTGARQLSLDRNTIRHWGYYDWFSPAHGVPLPNLMVEGQTRSTDAYLSSLQDVTYIRIEGNARNCSDDFTDARSWNLECIKEETRKLIEEQSDVMEEIEEVLRR